MSSLSRAKSQPAVDMAKVKSYLVNAITRDLEENPVAVDHRVKAVEESLKLAYQQIAAKLNLPETVRQQIFHEVTDDLLGYGPIQPLLDDDEISEVMVNGADRVYVERKGKLIKTQVKFENEAHVLRIIERIVLPLGRRIDQESPTVDARLPDGSRVNAVIPPVAIDGPSITIRKFGKSKLSVDELVEIGTLTAIMAEFLHACVIAKMNIIISGGTGSGKTTLLNVLSRNIPDDERIVTIEDAAELQLRQEHIVRMETKPANLDGKGMVTVRDLVRNSLRMRPDRIVVGECRGAEALDMLQAMNTGHDGSLTTVHANSPRDSLARVETMIMMAGMDLPLKVVREQIASAIDLIVQLSRLRDGRRKITAITEVAGMEGDTIVLTDVFKFNQTGIDKNDMVIGELKPTGIRPLFMPRLEAAGFRLGPEVFGASVADILAQNRRKR